MIEGKNPVLEALKSGRAIDKILVAKQAKNLQTIIDMARDRGIPIQFVHRKFFQKGSKGVVAHVAAHEYCDINNLDGNFVVVLDGICDPHNLGSIIRTADATGVSGIIIPKRGSVGLTETVAKTSAGAIEYVKVARVSNIASALDRFKKEGFWIYGAALDDRSKSAFKQDYDGKVVLVIGNEGNGISSIVKQKCDFLVKIPMHGQIESLNASVSAGILMYEVAKSKFS